MINSNTEQVLCHLNDIEDGQARGFLRQRNADRVLAVRQGVAVYVYLNACPHEWVAMELSQDKFLNTARTHIMCHAHAALFDIRTGDCTAGPCEGAALIKLAHRIEDGMVVIAQALPLPPRQA